MLGFSFSLGNANIVLIKNRRRLASKKGKRKRNTLPDNYLLFSNKIRYGKIKKVKEV